MAAREPARLEAITAKVANARLDWALQSDEPADLIEDLAFVLDQLAARDPARPQVEEPSEPEHDRGCPAIADDESDQVLADYQECVCDSAARDAQWRKVVDFHRDMAARFAESRDELKHKARELEGQLTARDRALVALPDQIVQRVAELPDRTSPDDWPEAMLVTADELRSIVGDQLDQLLRGSPAGAGASRGDE